MMPGIDTSAWLDALAVFDGKRGSNRRLDQRRAGESRWRMSFVGVGIIISVAVALALLAALPARVLAETPLYFAAFTTPTPGWATRAATKDDSRSARFTSQGYELALDQSQQALQDNNNIENKR